MSITLFLYNYAVTTQLLVMALDNNGKTTRQDNSRLFRAREKDATYGAVLGYHRDTATSFNRRADFRPHLVSAQEV